MSYGSERVEEFRNMVDEVIARQVNPSQNSPLRSERPDYNQLAKAGTLTFISRSETFDGKHVREIRTGRMNAINRRLGFMAIRSTEAKPDSLTRIWSIESRVRSVFIESEKPLTTHDALSDAILWARSPEFEVGRFSRLSSPTPEEVARITPILERIDETARRLSYDLNQINDRRGSGLDAEDILARSGFHADFS